MNERGGCVGCPARFDGSRLHLSPIQISVDERYAYALPVHGRREPGYSRTHRMLRGRQQNIFRLRGIPPGEMKPKLGEEDQDRRLQHQYRVDKTEIAIETLFRLIDLVAFIQQLRAAADPNGGQEAQLDAREQARAVVANQLFDRAKEMDRAG